jgi:hypothetical protein
MIPPQKRFSLASLVANRAFRNTFLCLIAIVFMIKGLGGSFNEVFNFFGAGFAHGPSVGFLIFVLIAASVASSPQGTSVSLAPNAKRKSLAVFFAVWATLMVAAVVLRSNALQRYPIDPSRADMLPAVLTQIRDFLSGVSVYGPARLENGEEIVRLYWPVLWGSYLPFYLVGVDIRYLNLAAHLLFYLLATDCFLRRRSFFGWGFCPSSALFIFVLALHVFSKQAIRDVYDVQTGPYWIFYSLFVWAVSRQRPNLAAVIVPFVLLCRQPAFLLFIPYWIWLAKNDRRLCLRSLGLTFILGLGVLLPFLWTDAAGLLRGLTFYSALSVSVEDSCSWYGLSGFLKALGLLWLQTPLQIGGLGACCWWVFSSKSRNPLTAVGAGVVAYTWFMLFVAITFKYLFVEPLLFLIFLFTWPLLPPHIPEPKTS